MNIGPIFQYRFFIGFIGIIGSLETLHSLYVFGSVCAHHYSRHFDLQNAEKTISIDRS